MLNQFLSSTINIGNFNVSINKIETLKFTVDNVELTKNVNGNIIALIYFKGNIFKATYEKDSDTYKLYRDNISYNVNIFKYNSNLVFDVDFDSPEVVEYGDRIVLKDAYDISKFILGANTMQVISAVLLAVAKFDDDLVTWYAVDALSKVISKTEVTFKFNRKIQIVPIYYLACLVKGRVVINLLKPINYDTAVATLKSGLDIFATNNKAAEIVASGASIDSIEPKWEPQHKVEKGFYPHWHPGGVKSAMANFTFNKNPDPAPHCWYPVE